MTTEDPPRIYATPDTNRFFALPADVPLPPGDTVVRAFMGIPEHADLEALAEYEISREEGIELARARLSGPLGDFEGQLLGLAEALRSDQTKKALTNMGETLKRMGQKARERRRKREAAKEADGE